MAGSNIPIVGVGPGQTTRPDFEAESHQANLRPGHNLSIPQQGVGGTQHHPEHDDGLSGWDRSEAAFEAGGQHLDGRKGWDDFSGERRSDPWSGPSQGTVQVDGPGLQGLQQHNVVARNPEDWVKHAAALEETFRLHGEKYGINAELKLPGDGPEHGGPTGTGRRNGRRQFTLKTG